VLVNSVAYLDGRRLADVPLGKMGDYLGRTGVLVWVALVDPGPEELDGVQAEFHLHPLAVEDARHGHQRPKVEEYGESLFLVLQTAELRDGEVHVGEVAVFVGEDYLVSVRRGSSLGFSDVRARCEREPELLQRGSTFVAYALMDQVVDRLFPVIDELADRLEEVEELIFRGQSTRDSVEAAYQLKKRIGRLQHLARPLLEATTKLHGGRVPRLCQGMHDYFRDVHDHLQLAVQTLDGLAETVTSATAMNLALISLQENITTKRLASYAALLAVPTLIVGVYGMNFEHMPELKWEFGYWAVLAAIVAVDLTLWWRFRRADWL